jgi:hypothetical protein
MADRKSGPVKPPVIDLTARDAGQGSHGARKPAAGRRAPAQSSSKAKAATAPAPDAAAVREDAPEAAPIADASPTPESAAAEDQAAATAQPPEAPAADTAEPPRTPPQPQPQPSIPPPPRPQARLAMPWSAISIAAIAGALLGAGLTYLLAAWIALPSSTPPIDDPAPELTEQAARLAGLEQRFSALEEAAIDSQVGLDTTIARLDTGFTDLRGSIEEVRAAIPPPVDLSGIEAELRSLESRLDATAAGASSEDAAALAQSLAALTTRISDLDRQMAQTDATIEGLTTDLAAARSTIAAQTSSIGGTDVGPAVKLPLIVSGLESAFASGRPYAVELASLTAILPDLDVPAALETSAQAGLARPDDLANRFSAAVPNILAGRAATATGDLGQDALEWAKALLALRPAGEIEGDTPEAVISRLEGAMQRRDFITAAVLLEQLPEPMRVAAGALATEISAQAEAQSFVAALRAQALAPAAETAP